MFIKGFPSTQSSKSISRLVDVCLPCMMLDMFYDLVDCPFNTFNPDQHKSITWTDAVQPWMRLWWKYLDGVWHGKTQYIQSYLDKMSFRLVAIIAQASVRQYNGILVGNSCHVNERPFVHEVWVLSAALRKLAASCPADLKAYGFPAYKQNIVFVLGIYYGHTLVMFSFMNVSN